MITEEELKGRIFFIIKFDKKKAKSSIAHKIIFNLGNRLRTIRQMIDLC